MQKLRGFQRFSTEAQKLPPKSVGASVDKVFAIRYRPSNTWPSWIWSKIDQARRETVIPDKSRIFFGFCGEN
jgi:hypothetical protein